MQSPDVRMVTEAAQAVKINAATAPLKATDAAHDQRLDDLEVLGGLNPGNVNDSTMASLARNKDSEFYGELSSTIGESIDIPLQQPEWATTTKKYAPGLHAYNLTASNLSKWRAARDKAAMQQGQAHVSCFLDSITYGAAATGVTSPKPLNSWPGRLRRKLDSTFGRAGTGMVVPWNTLGLAGSPADDPRWSFAGVVSDLANFGLHGYGLKRFTSDGDVTPTHFEFGPVECDEFWIYRLYGNGSRSRITIEGGAEKLIPNGTGNSPDITDYDAEPGYGTEIGGYPLVVKVPVPLGLHTIKVSPPSASGFRQDLVAVEARIKGKGVRVSNFGHNGRASSHLVLDSSAGQTGMAIGMDMARADLAVMLVGMNDFNTHVSVATFKANIITAVQRQRMSGATGYGGNYADGDVLLVAAFQPDYANIPPDHIQSPAFRDYLRALYEVADEQNVPLLDLAVRWGDYAKGSRMGYFADPLHPNNVGSEDIAQAVFDVLMSA